MISIVYCTRETKPEYKEHLIKSSGVHKGLDIIEIINNGESLTKAYNRGLKQAKHDVVVFCHDDITIETKQWGKKLIKQFDKNPEYGIIGVAGSKYMGPSGQWWADRSTMYGRVKHTNEGKTWLSAYSDDQGVRLEEVVNVDGVFFAIDKTRIKKEFDESVEGFHFYDVDFSFNNHIAGCKVGVSTVIRVNHLSMGATNEEWEENRKIFADNNKDKLPVRIKETFEHRKLKVLMVCPTFNGTTPDEDKVFEVAKDLISDGGEVSLCSIIGEPKLTKAHRAGIKMYNIYEPAGYKLGDGKWGLNTPQGQQLSKENQLYLISQMPFDAMYVTDGELMEHYKKLYPYVKVVDINSDDFIDMDKTSDNFKELFIDTYNG